MEEDQAAFQQLGSGAVVGDEIWDQQSRVRIKLGPLTLSQYCAFLPDGDAFAPLKAIVKFFCNDELDFDVRLFLKREEVPKCDTSYEGDASPRLGWVSWLKSAAMDRDPGDAILRL
jgi:type VI secretion system protein ImpH